MTKDTLLLFSRLLDQVSLQASDPSFEQAAASIVLARKELEAELVKA